LPAELVKDQETFVLRVKGDSMIKAGILDKLERGRQVLLYRLPLLGLDCQYG
ncbi:hypothetical protein HKBW3S42_01829, partial [Candidatus Hakubella thermalkaliphila]